MRARMPKFLLATAAASALALAVPAGADDAARSAGTIATNVCQSCHGTGGNSASSTFPRLNGQQPNYLVTQLKNFRDHQRSDPHARAYMWGMASQLDDATIAALAKYFADQKPTSPQQGGALAAEGKTIYENGAAAENVPPCAACHGDHGEGNDTIPRLAGQHADYLKAQLEAFRSTLRESDVMHANTKDMTDRQIEALTSYLAND